MKFRDHNDSQWIVLERSLIVGLVIYVLFYLTAFRFGALLTDDARQADFQMWYLLPPQIGALDYPSVIAKNWNIPFPYLPSAVAMLLPLSLMPRTVAFIVWMVLQCASFAVVLWASLHLAGIAQSRMRLPVAAAFHSPLVAEARRPFRDVLAANGVPAEDVDTVSDRDYVKHWFHAANDALEDQLIRGLRLAEVPPQA